MKKHAVWGMMVGVLIVVGGWYVYSSRENDGAPSFGSRSTGTMQGSMKDLLSRSSSKCLVSSNTGNAISRGEVYVGNGMMRGEFVTETTNPVANITSYLISDGKYMYTWSDSARQGVKIAIPDTAEASESNMPSAPGMEMYETTASYECDSWRVDESLFVTPKDIQFADVSDMTSGRMPSAIPTNGVNNPPSKSMMCNACDQAPEPQRSQCRESIGCR
jgi:hypothetical protein